MYSVEHALHAVTPIKLIFKRNHIEKKNREQTVNRSHGLFTDIEMEKSGIKR